MIDVLPRAAVRADKDPHPARVGLPRVERGAGAGFVHIKGGREDKHLVGIVAVGPVLVLARHVVPGIGDLGKRAALPIAGKVLFYDVDGGVNVVLRIHFGRDGLGLHVLHIAAAGGKSEQQHGGQKQG